ncbi:MAG: PEP-CTERM sorting domain-containing protein [Syntrophaceae bacterium]|nr:PEP-CTERM sorting domain-containing protein [Syntrophaceae bacterium]
MKRLLVCTVIMAVVLTFGTFASAAIYTFDFNSLENGSGPGAISTYMTNIFGNSVVVSNYPVSSSASIIDPSSDPSRYGAFFETKFLGALGNNTAMPGFTIAFGVPITSLSFDWGSYYDRFGAYYLQGTVWNNILIIGGSPDSHHVEFTFPEPVSTLLFNGYQQSVWMGIDNLTVTTAAVPEPGTLILLGLGLLGLGLTRYRTGRE